jgi:beta-lactam-binding protein with PASTA domain/predicted Ser/Thr protein kinase
MSQQGPVIFNGRYELHRRLGRGGMAEVYLARDQMLDRAVAVKVLFPALATDPGFVERFRREAQSAAALNHPNIVGVYDWGEANGTYFIVMEYVEGESLAELIAAEGRLHPDRAAEIGADIGAALGFAHRNGGVIHRDVKPGNVLITREGAVKVADFGIARAISDSSDQALTKTGSVMGTATYFSPEQARGAAVDPRSDVYSLGCVLYEMVTGRPPFSGENAVAIAYKHVQEAPIAPRRIDPALPETLEAIILKCLAKNPANRYPSAQDMQADLRRYLDGARIMAEPVLAPPVDPGATGVMAPTGYMQRTSTVAPTTTYGDDGYGDYDDYDDYEEPPPRRSKAFLIALVLLLLALAGLLFIVAQSLAGGGNGADAAEIEVPSLVGQQQAQAEAALERVELTPRVERQPSNEPPGTVIDQNPNAGATVEEGAEVTLVVSAGPRTVPVPDVTGQTQDDAIMALSDAGFTTTVQEEPHEEIPEGSVIRTDPPANTEHAEGGPVTVFVSTGAPTTTVPDVTGQPADAAQATLEGAGFSVSRREAPSNDVPEGNVISTDPGAGAEVDRGATVTMTVSTGPGQRSVPDVTGLSEDNARGILEREGFGVEVVDESTTDFNQDGQVIQQSPQGGSEADEGTTVQIIVGRFLGGGGGPPTTPTTFPGDGDGE